ncbi:MAG: hypothetical protein Q9169_002471 [Polycauliona sp. 2 TL-2023]
MPLDYLVIYFGHYLHLTKRFGIIAASQLPLHYLLALKSSWSPITYLTRLSHEELNPYHRALGRIILLFLSLHASFYLNFFIQKSLLAKRIRDTDVILGLLAITTFVLLGTTALAWVRRKILYFHVSHLRVYIIESAIIYIILIAQRNISTRTISNAKLTHLTANLISITIPLSPSSSSCLTNINQKKFHPGQHIYLSLPSHSKLRLNPFTIANLPHKDIHIRLVLRALNGTTRILSNTITNTLSTSKTSPTSPPNQTTTIPVKIEGPYGSAATFPDLLKYNQILFVAGGIGATFTLPIYRDLINRLNTKNENENERKGKVKFIWAVKSLEDANWAFEYLDESHAAGAELYISGSGDGHDIPSSVGTRKKKTEEDGVEVEDEGDGNGDEGIELQQRARLLSDDPSPSPSSSSSSPSTIPANLTIHHSRPNLAAIVNETFSTPQPGSSHTPTKVAVLVCGPTGMGAALRREVGVWVGRGREVWWHNEEFGW